MSYRALPARAEVKIPSFISTALNLDSIYKIPARRTVHLKISALPHDATQNNRTGARDLCFKATKERERHAEIKICL